MTTKHSASQRLIAMRDSVGDMRRRVDEALKTLEDVRAHLSTAVVELTVAAERVAEKEE